MEDRLGRIFDRRHDRCVAGPDHLFGCTETEGRIAAHSISLDNR